MVTAIAIYSCKKPTFDNPLDSNYTLQAPTNLSLDSLSKSVAYLHWSDPDFDPIDYPNAKIEFNVEESSNGVYFAIADTLTDTSVVIAGNFDANTTYYFRVRAITNSNSSEYSAIASGEIYSLPIPTNGLVAYYPFNADAKDESGNGNNGTVHSATPTTDRFGNPNSAYSFTNGSWIDFGDVLSNVFASNTYSISIWFELSQSNDGGLIYKWNTSESSVGNAFWATPTGIVTNNNIATTVSAPPVSVWIHYVYVMNQGNMSLYRNDTLKAQTTGNQSLSSTGHDLQVGGDINGDEAQYQFYGNIDDIRIYSRVLSSSEVNDLYHEGGWPLR